ncbi:MAG: hypothetical protein M3Q47_13280, partial [Actinomycetota bacterium]|nr:hypothetical protein [Actinomycetota bacterium]
TAALVGALAAMAAAVIAATAAVRAYKTQQAETRRQQKATFYAARCPGRGPARLGPPCWPR